MRTKPFARKKKLRVDLHGASIFGSRGEHTLIRWEWMTGIHLEEGVVIRSHHAEIVFSDGAFGLPSSELAELLREARSPDRRGEIIGRLKGRPD